MFNFRTAQINVRYEFPPWNIGNTGSRTGDTIITVRVPVHYVSAELGSGLRVPVREYRQLQYGFPNDNRHPQLIVWKLAA